MGKTRKKMIPRVESYLYLAAVENQMGWCQFCKAFTRRETEAYAVGYFCDTCGRNEVLGTSAAVTQAAFITIGNSKSNF
jgi:hypothetical protein